MDRVAGSCVCLFTLRLMRDWESGERIEVNVREQFESFLLLEGFAFFSFFTPSANEELNNV